MSTSSVSTSSQGQNGVIQGLAQNGVSNAQNAVRTTRWLGLKNLYLPALDSIGATTFFAAAIKALPHVGAIGQPVGWSERYLVHLAASRRGFFELTWVSWAGMGYEFLTSLTYLVIGIIALPFGKTGFLQEAFQAGVRTVSNIFFTGIGIVGLISPKYAYGLVGVTLLYASNLILNSTDLQEEGILWIAATVTGLYLGVQVLISTLGGADALNAFNNMPMVAAIRQHRLYRALEESARDDEIQSVNGSTPISTLVRRERAIQGITGEFNTICNQVALGLQLMMRSGAQTSNSGTQTASTQSTSAQAASASSSTSTAQLPPQMIVALRLLNMFSQVARSNAQVATSSLPTASSATSSAS